MNRIVWKKSKNAKENQKNLQKISFSLYIHPYTLFRNTIMGNRILSREKKILDIVRTVGAEGKSQALAHHINNCATVVLLNIPFIKNPKIPEEERQRLISICKEKVFYILLLDRALRKKTDVLCAYLE